MTTFNDDFNRANEAPLAGDWETIFGAGLNLISNAVNGGSGRAVSAVKSSTALFGDDQESSCTLSVAGTFDDGGPAVRCTANNCYYMLPTSTDSYLEVRKIVAGVDSQVSGGGGRPTQSGDVLKLTIEGNTLKMFVNNVQQGGDITDNDLTSGQVGLAYLRGNNGGARLDDFSSTDGAIVGPTLTGPDSTTDGTNTVETGTLLDTVTTQSLVSGSYEVIQSIDTQVPAQLEYIANSGVNDCVPGTPAPGVPLKATILAQGIDPYIVQQKADDGVNTPVPRTITLNAPATHDVVQTMIASANTIDDQSIFGASWIDVEDNMQAYVPKVVDGVNFTWAADGTFTTDQDKTVNVRVPYFAPSTGQYGCIDFTIQGSTIISFGMITEMIKPMISNMIEDM